MKVTQSELASSYDRVAKEYAGEFALELDKKPFDRKMLELLIEKVGNLGTICDVGCGPGQIAGYLHQMGAGVCGVDLSEQMINEARTLNPAVPFHQGDMLDLKDVADDSFGGIAAFYSIIHIPRESVIDALRELRRVLRHGGTLLLTFHIGNEIIHRDEWWNKPVDLDFIFFETDEMTGYLAKVNFELQEVIERSPYRDVEYPSRRGYIFARKI
ncbi:MAG TPA: class I SAM-dependent methyltransferase [Pyrinomonadaceae bacterium]|nr:class I SAM-dependent methyltransferase [Pyrinomonadaceae bacterium]